MAKIDIKHSSIVINDYTLGDCPQLENTFSLWDSVRHKKTLRVLHYNEETRQLFVPRGVDVFFIENLLDANARLVKEHDRCDKLPPILLKYLPRDDVQKRALAFMLGMKEYTYTKAKSQLSVNLIMGKGKTYCSIAASTMFQLRTAIITTSVGWLEQWRKCILEYTDTKPNEICMMVGSGVINRLMANDGYKKYKYILMSHATIKSYASANGWDKITELFKHLKIGVKFYDECHLGFENMCMIDYYTNTYKTFYVSGTPARSDKDEDKLFSYYFKSVPSISLFDEEQDPHTRYIAIKYNSHPTALDISNCKNVKGFQKQAYAKYVIDKPNFYKLLNIILDIALQNGGKNLIFVARIESIEIIRDWILVNYPYLYNDIGIYHSKVEPSIKEQQLDKRIILSTVKSLGTAQDIKGLKMTVNLAEPFSSEVLAKQSLYRTRDDNTIYLDCIDIGFNTISKYYRDKLPVFNKYALSCSLLNLNDNELQFKNDIAVTRLLGVMEEPIIVHEKSELEDIVIIHPKD